MDAVLRLALLGLLAAGSFALVAGWQRRPVRPSSTFRPGVTVYVGPDCGLCGPLLHALGRAGVSPALVDAATDPLPPGIRSLPTVVVVDASGSVVLRRSGRAALDDVITIAGLTGARPARGARHR